MSSESVFVQTTLTYGFVYQARQSDAAMESVNGILQRTL